METQEDGCPFPTQHGARDTEEVTEDRHNEDTVSILGPTPTKGLLSASSGERFLTNGQEKEAWGLWVSYPFKATH